MELINPKNAPKAVGPYSIAVKTGNLVFVSGQLPITENGELVKGDIKRETEIIMKNIEIILKEAGSALGKIVKINVYIRDMSKFSEFNEIYEKMLNGHKPARAVVEVSNLPKDSDIEIEAIAEV
ncbi:endoribonuclease L-PSP [Thermosipho affectus]|uniref:Endoribonuclease L-PSP n=1 Tax=Thermosipho affectus TaxID=660294 RepID=A0ABX3IIH0_9BACT|nr:MULTISPECIES: Rid family detoxifying hydrolase [Thermosipho]ANQ53983.1 dfrA [Thermosipho sp. 1070]APT72428.1 endoribonuclease L-PSP [Thermosipho sp. 1063]ONN26994.1 endoribonuclease L-PSP [Thermosipho affectus]